MKLHTKNLLNLFLLAFFSFNLFAIDNAEIHDQQTKFQCANKDVSFFVERQENYEDFYNGLTCSNNAYKYITWYTLGFKWSEGNSYRSLNNRPSAIADTIRMYSDDHNHHEDNKCFKTVLSKGEKCSISKCLDAFQQSKIAHTIYAEIAATQDLQKK